MKPNARESGLATALLILGDDHMLYRLEDTANNPSHRVKRWSGRSMKKGVGPYIECIVVPNSPRYLQAVQGPDMIAFSARQKGVKSSSDHPASERYVRRQSDAVSRAERGAN
jgi:hypothetical protein